ncbi:hypothetical protein HPP92_012910 [Vanilla planifolia]|uniref:CCHC-type domain-containing protein n=1 Tax=Vanilla planifolia TaxID=51239 RepID=A0A835QRE4_VANPL|nr:hypothetical protein HPP92_012910 [Vanilla planifolia]
MAEDGEVLVSSEACQRRIDFHKYDLVGRIFGNTLPFPMIARVLLKRWGHHKNFRVFDLSSTCFCLHFESKEARNDVWLGEPWQIVGQAMGLDVWSHEFTPGDSHAMCAPIWVRFPGLPLIYWDADNILCIAKAIGDPFLLDGWTAAMERASYAQVCIRTDLSKPLKPGVWLKGDYGRIYQSFEYEGLPRICFSCGRVGHLASQCNVQLTKEVTQPGHGECSGMRANGDQRNGGEVLTEVTEEAHGLGPWMLVQHRRRKTGADARRGPTATASHGPRNDVQRTRGRVHAGSSRGVSRPSRERGRSRPRRGSPSRSRAQHLADSGDRSLGAEGAEREARGGGVKGKLLGSMTAREKEPPTSVGGNAA